MITALLTWGAHLVVAEEEEGIVDQVDQVSSAQVINLECCVNWFYLQVTNFTPSKQEMDLSKSETKPQSVSPAVVSVVVNALLQVC